ncbi:cell division protein FtsX [Sodalis-like endosymbiont of Proechinophthirus fluctus]|uniref:cell envelope integrity protein TolA n=1 Tax=Sodalis-like endosymbiont of Proechinophthirus fluctus TaxID=1462730 RepID=UPI0007A8A793|nr:cell envelope integrity protein TolA [Sodalis-like endosymbiont of Proechinophthirus fluctus]KYP97587.1 cell division protein FtsX [Sodalis-like endosymbiont of Proechinophthirus fluctus]
MLKATEQNDKFKRAIILSIALHSVLIAILIWISIHQPQESSAGSGGSSVDAVMIAPSAVVQQYNRQQKTYAQRAQHQAEEHRQKQAAEQQRLAAQEAAEVQQREQAKQQKLAEEEEEATSAQAKTAAEAKKQAEVEAKKTAVAKAKAKADQIAKNKATSQAKKQSSDVDVLLGGLTNAKNMPKAGSAPTGVDKAKQSGASGAEIDAYKAQISRAISNKFYDASSYSSRTCDLRIGLAPDGLLISVTAVGGDPALCQAAVSAAKLAIIPRPPSPQVYEVFKNATLGFSPQ